MRKILLLLILISSFAFGQNLDPDKEIQLNQNKIDSLNNVMHEMEVSPDAEIRFIEDAIFQMQNMVLKVTSLEDFNNRELQKAFVNSLGSKYSRAFDYEDDGKIKNYLRYGFESKEQMIRYYKLVEPLVSAKIILRQYDLLIKKADSNTKAADQFLKVNLPRIGMTRESFNKLSESDQKAIVTELMTSIK